jgi:hypothetical protein
MPEPKATHDYANIDAALEFLKRTRFELRELRKVYVWKDRLQVFDINGDSFELRGIGYASPDIVPVLNNINTAYNPQTIHEPVDVDYKEFKTGKRRAWAEDRVM